MIENAGIKIVPFSTQIFLFADAVVPLLLFRHNPGLIVIFTAGFKLLYSTF